MDSLAQFEEIANALDIPSNADSKGQLSPVFELTQDAEFFHTPDGDAYASIPVKGHIETWALKSRGFKEWLSRRFFLSEGKIPSRQKIRDALGVLSGKAKFEGVEREVHIRLVEHAGDIYLDLTDSTWRVVHISRDGWNVISASEAPVRFHRRHGMLALPEPVSGGSLDELRQFVNLGSEEDWVLLASWVVAALRPRGPFPILALHGEQGSAKSTTARLLCSLIDPNAAMLRSEPRGERDLMIAATNKWLVTLDNLSKITDRLSDSLCRLATGAGFATRELRTDTEEIIFNAQRPIILNGIEEVATRNDLLDRALVLYLPSIPEEKRRVEEEHKRAFEQARPRILGALMEALSTALSNIDSVQLDRLPRLADFAKWGTAAEPALGLGVGAFMAAYNSNRADANEMVLDSSSIGKSVLALMDSYDKLSVTSGELLRELNTVANTDTRKRKDWPGTPKGMSDALRRITTTLRAYGVQVQFGRREAGTGRRLIHLEKVC
ncbi:MAG TPA: hypothetical protein VGC66_17800 [Pyrinomonadaceae bacterium]|jgi:hypothetical protein